MPPLKGIDRGLTGEALMALEESGHGRRIAIVDASYSIPRWAQVINYRGKTSAEALAGILALVPRQDEIDDMHYTETAMVIMAPDPSDNSKDARKAGEAFGDVIPDVYFPLERNWDQRAEEIAVAYDEDNIPIERCTDPLPPFYELVNNEAEDTLFIRTPDTLPYACATFVVGHSQRTE